MRIRIFKIGIFRKFTHFWLSIAILNGCEKGLEPTETQDGGGYKQPYGISGNIYFKNFISRDSVKGLFVAASQESLLSKSQIPSLIFSGKIEYIDVTTSYGQDTIPYSLLFKTIPPGKIPYIAVVHQFGVTIAPENLQIIGLYYNDDDTTHPGFVIVPKDSIVSRIDISVDFNKLPPQPPE